MSSMVVDCEQLALLLDGTAARESARATWTRRAHTDSQLARPISSPAGPTATTPVALACTARTARASLGLPAGAPTGGQETFTLRYADVGESPCAAEGYPGATLAGPDFPGRGDEFPLRRSIIRPPDSLVVPPGKNVVADLTVLTAPPGSAGSWTPTRLLTVAPDDTTMMAVPWPPNTPVLRQDGATHPGSYVGSFHPDG